MKQICGSLTHALSKLQLKTILKMKLMMEELGVRQL